MCPSSVIQDGIECEWHDYQVIAVSAHHGGTRQGHYETLPKIDLYPVAFGNPKTTVPQTGERLTW